MNISDIKIRRLCAEKRLRALVSITINNAIAIHDIKIIEGDDRYFIAMPSRKEPSGIYRDIVHPISEEARKYIESEILKSYEHAKEETYLTKDDTEI
ncbi:MAG: septation regulator SpoVG [Oscillospiraceae bacterium]